MVIGILALVFAGFTAFRFIQMPAFLSSTAGSQISLESDKPLHPALSGLILNGIIYDEIPQAIINNEMFLVGDSIRRATVRQIGDRAVVLEFEGKFYTLRL